MVLDNYLYFCTRNSNYSDSNDTKQAIQYLQGGTGPGGPAGVLHGAWGAARDGAGRDAGGGGRAGAVGGLRGAGLLQVHGAQRRGGQGLLHGLRLRGRVRGRLPLLPRRRRVGGEHRGGHAVRGARHQRTGAADTVRQRPEDGEDGREDPEEPVQDGLWTRPRPLPLHRPQPLPSAHRTLSAGGADALVEGHRLVPQHYAQLSEHTPQGAHLRQREITHVFGSNHHGLSHFFQIFL